MPSWIQDSKTGKLIPKEEYSAPQNDAPVIHGDLTPFISPITRELISDRGQLRRHNAKHGVTDSRDYSPEFIKERSNARDDAATGNTRQARNERRELINQEMRKRGI